MVLDGVEWCWMVLDEVGGGWMVLDEVALRLCRVVPVTIGIVEAQGDR